MGKKTSVYLSDEQAERLRASSLPLAEVIRRGLDAVAPEQPDLEAMLRRIIREELAAVVPAASDDCPHPPARINKGLCGNCGTYVGTTKGGK